MIFRIILLSFSWLLMGAHFSRADNTLLMVFSLMAPFLLLIKKKWAYILLIVLTNMAAISWIITTIQIIDFRKETGDSWTRMAIILICVAIFTSISGLLLLSKKVKAKYL